MFFFLFQVNFYGFLACRNGAWNTVQVPFSGTRNVEPSAGSVSRNMRIHSNFRQNERKNASKRSSGFKNAHERIFKQVCVPRERNFRGMRTLTPLISRDLIGFDIAAPISVQLVLAFFHVSLANYYTGMYQHRNQAWTSTCIALYCYLSSYIVMYYYVFQYTYCHTNIYPRKKIVRLCILNIFPL